MNEGVKLLLLLSLSGSILSILILAIKPLMKHKLSKTVQYYIWLIVLLRLVFPFSFENSVMNDVFYGNTNFEEISNGKVLQSTESTSRNQINTSIVSNFEGRVIDDVDKNDIGYSRYFKDLFNRYALHIWLLGLTISIIIKMVQYIIFLRYLKAGHKPASNSENQMLNCLLNRRENVRLIRNKFVSTPMLIGIFRPCIIIPDGNFNEIQLKNILLHEISHLRHWDIIIKWMTMIVTSIHWFNPMMYLIKREMYSACELACDEAVISNLSPQEKQAYGDTLIDVIAEHRYPTSALQVTMCEEKKNLKERLIAIMKHNKKSKFIIVISVILLAVIIYGALYLGAGIKRVEDLPNPPNIYIKAEGEKIKAARVGTYSWTNGNEHSQSNMATDGISDHPVELKYGLDNVLSVGHEDKLVISTKKLNKDKKYKFTVEDIEIYKNKQLVEFENIKSNFKNNDLYIQAPPKTGEYVYSLKLKFKDRGLVNYSFVVRVDMITYNLDEISKYKTPYVGDASKVGHIAGLVPVPHRHFVQRYIYMKTEDRPYKLTICYEPAKPVSEIKYKGEWPIVTPNSDIEINSRTNALVVFAMIDNLDEVTFAFRISQSDGRLDESKYDTQFTFTRASFEEKYGDLSVLGDDLNLLWDILTERIDGTKGDI